MVKICGKRNETIGLETLLALFCLFVCLKASLCDKCLLDASVQLMVSLQELFIYEFSFALTNVQLMFN